MHDTNRKGSYFLNNAFIKEYPSNNNNHDFPAYSWTINYTNGRKHTLSSAIPIKKKTELLMNGTNSVGNGSAAGNDQKKSKRTHLNPLERKKVTKKKNDIFNDSYFSLNHQKYLIYCN